MAQKLTTPKQPQPTFLARLLNGLLTLIVGITKLIAPPRHPKPSRSSTARHTYTGSHNDLEQILFPLTENDPFRVSDSFLGTVIFGDKGSGKTSGSGENDVLSKLRADWGGVVGCVKDDVALWREYARITGREKDFIFLSEHTFNQLEYEMNRPGQGAGIVSNIIALFKDVQEVHARQSGTGGDGNFWSQSNEQMLSMALKVLKLSRERVTIPNLRKLLESIATSPSDIRGENSEKWYQGYLGSLLSVMEMHTTGTPAEREYEIVGSYFTKEIPELAEKTRSIIKLISSQFLMRYEEEPLHSIFCTTTSVIPEDTWTGKVIVIDLPIDLYHELGYFAHVTFISSWLEAMRRRDVSKYPLPNFIFVDECQEVLFSRLLKWQQNCRSYRVAPTYLTQNLGTLAVGFGGGGFEGLQKAKAFVALNGVKIFHACSHDETLTAAQDLTKIVSRAETTTQFSDNGDSSFGAHSVRVPAIQKAELTSFRTGGAANDFKCDALIHRVGAPFKATNANYIKRVFHQRRKD